MGYRDEEGALRARVAHLEGELDEAHAEIERLRGASPDAFGEPNALLGGPTELGFEREVDRELDDETLEELVGILRHELGDVGRLDRLGGTLTWVTSRDPNQGGRRVEVTIERRRGRTRVAVRERLGQVAGGLFGGIVGGVGGGGLGGVIPAAIFGGVAPVLIPVLALGWVGGTWAAVRLGYRALTRRRAREHARIARRFDTVIGTRANVRARVEEDESVGEPVEVEAAAATRRGREA
ncbi:MAG: hypothetical protein H6723_10865 [Sandaracinus sp.]|nr:hypothetical protein [Myxococcales bacterium]MCB9623820.1 hypothetical protein [Sandaracinus sp.]